ncbi:MAG: glycosyltransferase family 4 protein [Xanthomonadales bacterium]|nr:glycosyltransferase family 4 protein [Xanthomonadales bacterium]MDH4021373.1 glycosyltransferase family 4 protein [Xanthomonadales bacterium]
MNLIAGQGQAVFSWLAVALFAGVLSYFGCIKALALAERSGMIALPGNRQSHQNATPTGGGLGLVFSIVMTTVCLELIISLPAFWWQKILPGVMLLTFIGWLDDKNSVSALLRLLIQLVVSIWLVLSGSHEFSVQGLVFWAAVVFGMVWLMNVYNFMDGSNGMAGFQGVFAGVTMAVFFQAGGEEVMALVAVAVAAACAGFLPLNFPVAKLFMGDVSSVPLGFIFAAFAVYGEQTGSMNLFVTILIMSVFFIDATLTLLSRAFRGERWYTAHAQHVYQRLIATGWSHRRVLIIYQAINVVLILPAIVLVKMFPQYAVVTVAVILLLLGTCWHIANRRLGMTAEVQSK